MAAKAQGSERRHASEPTGEPQWTPSDVELGRRAFRRRRAVRAGLIAGISTVAVIGLLVGVVGSSQGWKKLQAGFFDVSYGWQVLPDVASGLWLNMRLWVVAEACILVLALMVALARTLRGPIFFPLRAASVMYTDLFRGLPMILVLMLFGFGMPKLKLPGLPTDALFWGCVALVLSYSAYVSEVFRAGIESIHPSQRAASRSLGLKHGQTMRYVVVPQAIRRVMPPLLNDAVSLMKDTGLISILGVVYDAVLQAKIHQSMTFNYTPYVVAGLLFVIVTIPLTRFTDYVARRQGWVSTGGV